MKRKSIEFDVAEFIRQKFELTRQRGSNIDKLRIRLGYVSSLFMIEDGGKLKLRQVVELPTSDTDVDGWRFTANWGGDTVYRPLFEALCPVVEDATYRHGQHGPRVYVHPHRKLNEELFFELLDVVKNYYKLNDDDETLFACREDWRNKWRNEVVEQYRVEAETGWLIPPNENPASSRTYHRLVNFDSGSRSFILRELGYRWDVDVRSCHPVVLCHGWRTMWEVFEPKKADVWRLRGLEALVADPLGLRGRVAARVASVAGLAGADVLALVKTCLSALLHDSVLPVFSTPDAYVSQASIRSARGVVRVWFEAFPDVAHVLYSAFCADPEVVALSRDYRVMRRMMGVVLDIRTEAEISELAARLKVDNDKLRTVIRSDNRFYFLAELLEERVVRVVEETTHEQNPFRIHDGIVLREELDVEQMSKQVHEQTGYMVEFTCSKL